jgi:RNA polymerase sigma factor (sigma-70 family)
MCPAHAADWPEVRAAIAGLPERQRMTLFLRHYADLDYDQIAAVLGVARGTVAATLHAAHEKLRGVLQEVTR